MITTKVVLFLVIFVLLILTIIANGMMENRRTISELKKSAGAMERDFNLIDNSINEDKKSILNLKELLSHLERKEGKDE